MIFQVPLPVTGTNADPGQTVYARLPISSERFNPECDVSPGSAAPVGP